MRLVVSARLCIAAPTWCAQSTLAVPALLRERCISPECCGTVGSVARVLTPQTLLSATGVRQGRPGAQALSAAGAERLVGCHLPVTVPLGLTSWTSDCTRHLNKYL